MVVVNDASHLIGRENVVVEVLSTRATTQGLLIFARLADRGNRSLNGDPAKSTDEDYEGTEAAEEAAHAVNT
jgi:hypothetical protein